MSTEIRLPSLPELRQRGFAALVFALGAANALVSSPLESRPRHTRERDQWLSGLTVEHIEEEIRQRKARGEI